MNVLILHPGAMGSAVGRALRAAGHDVAWVSGDRSDATHERAEGWREVHALDEALNWAEIVFSIVPPHAAVDVAEQIASAGFGGLVVDGNAVAPSTSARVAGIVTGGGAAFVDGSLIGPPPEEPGDTRLYLSGERAGEVAALFEGSILDARVIGSGFEASGIKVCFGGWTKGSAALLSALRAYAKASGVEEALLAEWAESIPELVGRSDRIEAGIHRKAWRFAGEMDENARALDSAGLPPGFFEAAAEMYRLIDAERGRD